MSWIQKIFKKTPFSRPKVTFADNAVIVIHPYKYNTMWVFDDERTGLYREPFVSGAEMILDLFASSIPQAEQGFELIFSAQPFPGHQEAFERQESEDGGTWYFSPTFQIRGWLCAALFKYFQEAPERLYAQFKPSA